MTDQLNLFDASTKAAAGEPEAVTAEAATQTAASADPALANLPDLPPESRASEPPALPPAASVMKWRRFMRPLQW